jgi:hypothetical protein
MPFQIVLLMVAIYFSFMRKTTGIHIFSILAFAAATVVSAQHRADYIIVADPSVYTIYDQYQQPVSSQDQRRFLPHAPLRIIEKQVVLGDQITRALKFAYLEETAYLIMDEKGGFAGEKNRSNRQSLINCEALDDTIEVIREGLRVTGSRGATASPKRGALLLRVFRSNGRYYVLTLDGGSALFGWSSLEPRSSWKKAGITSAAPKGSDTLLPKELQDRLTKRIEQANKSYEALFSHFNSLTHNEKSIPQWQCTAKASTLTCTLSDPWRGTDELSQSTSYLRRDLEVMLLGTGFWLTIAKGMMVISRNAAAK